MYLLDIFVGCNIDIGVGIVFSNFLLLPPAWPYINYNYHLDAIKSLETSNVL